MHRIGIGYEVYQNAPVNEALNNGEFHAVILLKYSKPLTLIA